MSDEIKALGEFVVLKTIAESAGTEMKTESGLVIGIRETGEIPETCFVHSIGSDVPEGFVKIGEKTPIPVGQMKNVPHPLVAKGEKKASEISEKFISVHYKNIHCVYY